LTKSGNWTCGCRHPTVFCGCSIIFLVGYFDQEDENVSWDVWYMQLKTCVEIHVGKKVGRNTCNII